MLNIKELFEKHNEEFLKDEKVTNRIHPRNDLNAFLLLDKLAPQIRRDMVSTAVHDEIYLDSDIEIVARTATEEDILNLIRCGVRFDDDSESFCMFV